MHLCCCGGSHGDRGDRVEQGWLELPGGRGGQGGQAEPAALTVGRGRTAGHGQDRQGGVGPQTALARGETPNHHSQACAPGQPGPSRAGQASPNPPQAAQLQQQHRGTQTQGLSGTATELARLSVPWAWRVLVCERR